MARPRSGKPWKKRTWKRPAHGGGHLQASLKNQTPLEFATTRKYFTDAKARWEYLFHPDRNKWTPDSMTKPQGGNAVSRTTPTNG